MKRPKKPGLRRRQCDFVTPPAEMSANDRAEIARFRQYLLVKAAEKDGAPSFMVRAMVAAIYPDVAGQMGEEAEA